MFPIRDHNLKHRFPLINYLLIFINIIIFSYMFLLPDLNLEAFVSKYALIPIHFNIKNLVTSQFLHGGLLHILGNMMFLHIFGDSIEDRLGHFRYLIFYLLCGVAAGFTQYLFSPASSVPVIGASGAIAGVMGAYLLLFPKAKIDILIPLGLLFPVVTIPAQAMLLYWIGAQLIYSWGNLNFSTDNIAYTAHIGGFFSGIFLVFILLPRRHDLRV